MDAGAEAAWRERYEHTHELSAIQHGMNLLVKRGREAFMAEYQNDPTDPLASAELQQITAPAVLRKLNGLERGVVPLDAQTLTAAIDVQGSALYWGLVGWSAGFAGDVLAYGTYPDQGRPYFTLREVEKSFASVHQGASWEASLHAALDRLVSQLCDKEWLRDDGTVARVDRLIIDAGYGESTTTVYQFCRQSRHAAILLPFFGRTVAPGAVSMDEWKRKPGDRVGPGWRMPRPVHRQTRHVLADVNRWKSFVADRLLTPVGDAGSLGIYGRLPMEHRMLADQLAAETRTRVAANGRTSDVWRVKPNRDNHLLDVLAMAAVAASIAGEKIDDAALTRRLRSDPAPAAASAPVENPAPAPAPSSQPPPPRAPPRRPIGGSFMRGGFRIKV
jgi:phage terminase large subunit GpA-like protein